MISDKEFAEAEGDIHLVYGEFTLCGDAFDLSSDIEGYQWKKTQKRVVTCIKCARIIRYCKSVRTDPSLKEY